MKKLLFTVMVVLCVLSAVAQTAKDYYTAYIAKYAKQAQQEQKKHGIPASITLAQGLLESAAGRSDLAQNANNHFGIKCTSSWTGDSYTKDDDKKDECFRKYRQVSDSYEDHSQFLLRPRYESLFQLDITDYKGWAHGLKRCGYATDPGYAGKLIKLIEDYELAQYDIASTDKGKTSASEPQTANQIEDEPEEVVDNAFKTKRTRRTMAAVDLVMEHKVRRNNGRKYIVARLGDTFASLAYEYNMYEKTLRRYNDIVNPRYELHEGDKVYLYPKRSRAQRQYAVYRVKKGENIWQIAQDKGVKLKTIYRLNGIKEGENVTVNQELRLR